MKVAILTMFGELQTTYSLVNVVAEQLKMLLSAEVAIKMLVCEHFNDQSKFGIFLDERIEWKKVTNTFSGRQIEWHDYDNPDGMVHDGFFDEAEVIAQDLVRKLSDCNVCILHDILYQGWHLLHNVALRTAQKSLPNLKFISFSHSAPLNRPKAVKWPFLARYTPLPNTTFISLTYAGIAPLAKQYHVPEGHCRVVYNTLDILQNKSEDLKKLAQKVDLISPDILIIYPGRLTPGKRFDKVAAFAGALKTKGEKDVRVIFCDFASGDVAPQEYKSAVKLCGIAFGLDEEDMVFTSEQGFPHGFPRKAVLELFSLSNLFILPSFSEAFPLTALEAAACGNMLVLNQAVPSLDEIGTQMKAHFMRWDALNYGFQTKESYHPCEQAYYEENAEIVLNMLQENAPIYAKTLVRQRYNPKWVFKNQLAPILGF